MEEYCKVALDAMGGDNSPDEIIKGCVQTVDELESEIILIGDESKINALIRLLNEYGIKEVVRTGICGLERGEKSIKEKDRLFS